MLSEWFSNAQPPEFWENERLILDIFQVRTAFLGFHSIEKSLDK